jgi:hypothetical protein
MGMLIAIVVIFAVLILLTRAVGLMRGQRLGVADAETTSEVSPAAMGAGMGVVALILIVILYFGITQWQWLGRPNPNSAPATVTAGPVVNPQPVVGAGSPAPGQTAPSASPSK